MRINMFLALMFGAMILWPSLGLTDDGVWERMGAPQNITTKFFDISVCYQDYNIKVFAAESSATSHIWHSTNNGIDWQQPIHEIANHYYKQIIMEPNEGRFGWALVPGRTYTDNIAGPYKTIDYGETWERRTLRRPPPPPPPGPSDLVKCMAVDIHSQDFNTVYVGTVRATNYSHLYNTTDGVNWSAFDSGLPIDGSSQISDISLCEEVPTNIWCCWLNSYENSGGLYRYNNANNTWEIKYFDPDFGADAYPSKVSVSPTNPDIVYVIEKGPNYGNVFMTTNGTSQNPTWTLLTNSNRGICSAIKFTRQSGEESKVYMAFRSSSAPTNNDYSWVITTDEGDNLVRIPGHGKIPGNLMAYSIGVDPLNPANVFVGGRDHFYFSDDYGDHFYEREGTDPLPTYRLAIDLDPDVYKIYTQTGQLTFSSTNYGQSWMSEPCDTLPSGGIVRDWNVSDRWIAGEWDTYLHDEPRQGRLYYYPFDDFQHSLTWSVFQNWPLQRSAKCVWADPISSTIFAVGYYPPDPPFYAHFARICYSWDDGVTMGYSAVPGDFSYIRDIDARQGSSPYDTLIAADGINGAFRGIRNENDNMEWTIIAYGLDQDAFNIKYCPSKPNIAIAGTASGMYKCVNIGAENPSWSLSNNGIVIPQGAFFSRALRFHDSDGAIVFTSVTDNSGIGTFISADTGRSWIAMNMGLTSYVSHDFSSDFHYPDTFYAATDDGIYKLKNPVKSGILPSEPAEQQWGPGTVIVNGDVTVPEGVTLEIAAGTRILFVYDFDKDQGGINSTKSEMVVYGTLNVSGSQTEPVIFESSKPTGQGPGQWCGIYAGYGSHISMDHCIVRHGIYGIYAYKPNSLAVDNCSFESNSTAGIYYSGKADASDPIVRYSRIENCGTYGVRCSGRSIELDTDTLINNQYGISFTHDGTFNVRNCRIYFNNLGENYYGIWASKSSSGFHPILEGDSIGGYSQGGIYFNSGISPGHISNSTIVRCGVHGIYYFATQDSISGGADTRNHVEKCTYGLRLTTGSATVIRRTRFYKNTSYGARIETGSIGEFGNASPGGGGYNSFYGEGLGYYDLYNNNPMMANAQYNYWGEYPIIISQIFNANYSNPIGFDPLPFPRLAPPSPNIPNDFELVQIYPNPFNPSTAIKYSLGSEGTVNVTIFNIMGQRVKSLFRGIGSVGENVIVWDGTNDLGQSVSAGVYFCRVSTEEAQKTLKMTVLK